MDVPHRLGAEPFGLVLGFQSIHPALLQQLLVELLQFQRSELFQRDFADIGLDVVVNVTPVGLVGGGPHLHLSVVFKPYLHPLAHGVPANLGRIQPLRFLNGGFQLCFCLRLGLAQDVLVDGLARLRVTTGGISSFPSAVFPLAKISFPVGPSFCHTVRLLCSNTTYRKRGEIARPTVQS